MHDLLDDERLAEVAAHPADRCGNMRVRTDEDVGRCPGFHADWAHETDAAPSLARRCEIIEQFHHRFPDAATVEGNTRQINVRAPAHERVVSRAEHGHIARHRPSLHPTGRSHPGRERIVDGKHTHWRPICSWQGRQEGVKAAIRVDIDEVEGLPGTLGRPREAGESAAGKGGVADANTDHPANANGCKMLGRESADGFIIGGDLVCAAIRAIGGKIDDMTDASCEPHRCPTIGRVDDGDVAPHATLPERTGDSPLEVADEFPRGLAADRGVDDGTASVCEPAGVEGQRQRDAERNGPRGGWPAIGGRATAMHRPLGWFIRTALTAS